MPKPDLNKLFRKALKASANAKTQRGPLQVNWEKTDTMAVLAGNPNAHVAYQRGSGSLTGIKLPTNKLFRKAIKDTVKRTHVTYKGSSRKPKALGKEKLKETFNVDELAEFFGIPTWESLDDNITSDNGAWSYAHEEALKEGKSEEEAEELAMQAESEERDEYYKKWHDAMESAVEKTLAHINIELTPVKSKGASHDARPYEYKISPKKDWKDSAEQIRDIINGVGMFEFGTLKEFLDSGPYTPREAVLSHLGYANSYADVYGDRSAKDIYHREMR